MNAHEDFANRACACKDLECLKGVQAAQEQWLAAHGQTAVRDEDSTKKIQASGKRLAECAMKLSQPSGK